jgi:hypothetical protein
LGLVGTPVDLRSSCRNRKEVLRGTREHHYRLTGQRITACSESSGTARTISCWNLGKGWSLHSCHSSFRYDES